MEDVKKTKLKNIGEPIIPAMEAVYLDGPKSRGYEFIFMVKVFWELFKGLRGLHFVGPCITVFGSARFKPDNIYYQKAEEFGKRIAATGLTTMTGGGPGIMEAANKGAFEGGGKSVGCNIRLPFEQHYNPYLTKTVTFDHFFLRKTLLIKYSYAFIIMPGGFGTMDEFFETLTLVQTRTITEFPIVIFGKEFYADLMDAIQDMAEKGTISPEDLNLVLFTDSVDEAMQHIKKYIVTNYQIKKRYHLPWLLEKS
ncbi:MAG TPA: TIGR00730 family Rossman fold protein [Niabella sp.]|nr:TIGR00730 family Rossman fold protein [Niabella sp.]HOZ96223.1 TIGR00730 family Rossman fold protein [Niabella sp.]HQW13588.1 TIGR00730 family Rossman fold protein [Niabella sp.]HQX18982.1 TIGR00730 family Rossman fold protein [Niabella sp.]HQX40487.1 TIGR00730 family Rossman fold protein [Niabella sp.]